MKMVQGLRMFLGLCVGALALYSAQLNTSALVGAQSCQYVLGFATLHDLIPDVVGPCVTDQTYDAQGNASQQTANGVLTWRKADNWTGFSNGPMTWVNGPNGVQSRLSTQRFAWESNPESLPIVGGGSDGSTETAQAYLDDRSDAVALMTSFVNALNHKEYLRAYSYWEPAATQRPSYAAFKAGYADTQSVRLITGVVREGVAAGNLYAAVPAVLVAVTTGGATQTFVACYFLHLAQPAIQGVPPFQPWGIQAAQVKLLSDNVDTASSIRQVCSPQDGSPASPQQPADPNDVSANRYLDDRSTAQELVRSFVNALNRHEYVRAYSYWRSDAAQLQPFDQFQQGYANTQAVQLTLGAVSSDAGAGQLYYSVPVILVSQMADGAQETFAGCYVLHLSQPAIQDTPPFQPLAIQSANVRQITGPSSVPPVNQGCAGGAEAAELTPTPAPVTSTLDLLNTHWKLVSFGGLGGEIPVVEGSTVTLNFDADGQVGGTAGCNSYGGMVSVNGDAITFSQVFSTLMACIDENVTQQETNYLKALEAATRFALTSEGLTITYNNGAATLNFVASSE